MLSRSSSLNQAAPTPICPLRSLGGSIHLDHAYDDWIIVETHGLQVQHLSSFSACRWPYSGSRTGAHTLCFPVHNGLRLQRRDSAGSRGLPRFIPHTDSLSYVHPRKAHEAAPFALCYGLRFCPALPTEYDSRCYNSLAFAVPCRGKFSLNVTIQTRPQATHPKG